MKRKTTRQILVGHVKIGGDAPISVQSMTKTDTRNVESTLEQISSLAKSGCEIVRIAIPDESAAEAFKKIRSGTEMPLVGDIHFNHHLALKVISYGADCVRINPGNIGDREKVRAVINAAKKRRIPLRVGVNAGSLERDLLESYGAPTAEALFASAKRHIEFFESEDFCDIKVSLKASDVHTSIEVARIFSEAYDYPLHVGITEAGSIFSGTIKSSVGIGILLSEGIGDTIRVSLTGPPEEEVRVGFEILKTLGKRKRGPEIISCPTCGRLEVDLEGVIREVERSLSHVNDYVKIAIMGCAVNGPGEATEADIGVACGKGVALLFVNGEVVKKLKEDEIVGELVEQVERVLMKRQGDKRE